MTTCSHLLEEAALDLAWSLWAELGVSGWQRRHRSHAIDPEHLILFTAFIGDADPRLRDESTDWCITYGRSVSTARLKNLLAREMPAARLSFGATAATVNAASGLRWPGATEPRRFQRTNRSRVADFGRPSLVVLRLRALFGVGARAEIVRAFVADPAARLTASDLASDAGYTKRNIAESLDALRMAGLLEVAPRRNQLVYRLAAAKWLATLPGDMPLCFPAWRSVFRIIARTLETARRATTVGPGARAVEAADALHDLEADLSAVGPVPPNMGLSPDPWSDFEQWALAFATTWASGAAHPA